MISLINLVHSYPLHYAMREIDEVEINSPRENLKLVMEGKAECGMVSLLDYFRNMDSLKLIQGPNIHSRSRTISTIVISKGENLYHGARIAVTAQTETTSFYLEQILKVEFPKAETIKMSYSSAKDLLEEEQFALVIGDEALKAYSENYRILIDVGLHYSLLTSYYPVYAVMVSKEELSDERTGQINMAVINSKNFIQNAIKDGEDKGFSKELLSSYYRAIGYQFDDVIRRSIDYAYMNFKK